MIRAAILDDYQGAALASADWSPLAGAVELTAFAAPIPADRLAETLAPFEVIVAMRERTRFDAALLDALPKLRLLVTTGMVNAAIDMAAATRNGITVCGTSSHPHPTPEHAWALLLALARHIPEEDARLRRGGWQGTVGTDLAGKVLGLVGLGRVGGTMARYGRAFDMTVLAHSRSLTEAAAAEAGVRRAGSLAALLAEADVVSLHIPLTEATRHLIGVAELAAMKPGALLVNTSRAGIVDTAALVDALQAGRIAGAAVDVFDVEPAGAGNPLLAAPNTVLTPHLGYVTKANYARYYGDAAADIRAWLDGRPLRVLAAPEAGR